ncbi:hypothetical protein ARMGADRAFT_1079154 [Armillaria gallica]|uniref:Uncharacterized protein n=1 Tax=Armillaria gallica TaxID=47427 RepID=A0A2H3DGX9_ARMGA|nr:hypothetical protein ARMGADRAFT_1079154 [Armillaria gallica]
MVWAGVGGGRTRSYAIITTASSDEGCAGNARPYPHDYLLRLKYQAQVLATNGTLRAELLKGGLRAGMAGAFSLPNTNMASSGTSREDYGFVSEG